MRGDGRTPRGLRAHQKNLPSGRRNSKSVRIKKPPKRPAAQQIRWHHQQTSCAAGGTARSVTLTKSAEASTNKKNRKQEPAIRHSIRAAVEPAITAAVEPAIKHSIRAAVEPAITAAVDPAIRHSIRAAVEPSITTAVEPAIIAAVELANTTAVEPAIIAAVEPVITTAVEPAIEHANQPVRIARRTTSGPRLRRFCIRGRVNLKSGRLSHKQSSDYHQMRHQHQVLPRANERPTKHLLLSPISKGAIETKTEDKTSKSNRTRTEILQQELQRWGSSDWRPSPPPSATKFKGCSMPQRTR